VPRVNSLRKDIGRLATLQRELRSTLDRIDRTLKRFPATSNSDGIGYLGGAPRRPLRIQILDVLGDLGVLSYGREITACTYARYDVVIQPTRFGSLTNDEIAAYTRRDAPRSRKRTLWLCSALRHDDAAPIRRLLARSDWPLEKRIWAPTTGRVQHLRIVARLCELAIDDAVLLANPDVLYGLVQTYARDLPIKTIPDQYAFEEWRERALALLQEDDLEARDYDLRQQAAERWSGLSERHQLFGPPVGAVPEIDF